MKIKIQTFLSHDDLVFLWVEQFNMEAKKRVTYWNITIKSQFNFETS